MTEKKLIHFFYIFNPAAGLLADGLRPRRETPRIVFVSAQANTYKGEKIA